jgi:fucose 4-O-acetylase-like acetyltransferase
MTQTAPPDTRSETADAPADQPRQQHADQGEATGGRPTRPPARRDAHLDNAKVLGVLLVVCGHVLVDLRDATGGRALYLFIYLFHMPLFIVLAGYFSRGFSLSGNKARKLITNLAVPYVIFEVAFALYRWQLGIIDKPGISLMDPYYVTWFLMALFVWRLSTPVWQQLRWPIAAAVAISVLSGIADLPTEMDLYRMLGLLPFFVIGLMLKPEHMELLKRPRARVVGALVLLGGYVGVNLMHRQMTAEWALWRIGFADLHVHSLVGTGMRLGMLLTGAVLVAAFLAVVPARRMWFTRFGPATMYAYLLHGFGVKLVERLGWYEVDWLHTPFGVAVAMAACVAVGVLLMTAPVRRLTGWALAPKLDWAFTRPGTYKAAKPTETATTATTTTETATTATARTRS